MSQFTEEDLGKLMRLCRIKASPEEQARALDGLQKILKYIDQLQELSTDQVPPCIYVSETSNTLASLREDVPQTTLSRDEYLAGAPAHTGGMIRVPPILYAS